MAYEARPQPRYGEPRYEERRYAAPAYDAPRNDPPSYSAPRYEAPRSAPGSGYAEPQPPARSYADAAPSGGDGGSEVWSPSRYRAALANNR